MNDNSELKYLKNAHCVTIIFGTKQILQKGLRYLKNIHNTNFIGIGTDIICGWYYLKNHHSISINSINILNAKYFCNASCITAFSIDFENEIVANFINNVNVLETSTIDLKSYPRNCQFNKIISIKLFDGTNFLQSLYDLIISIDRKISCTSNDYIDKVRSNIHSITIAMWGMGDHLMSDKMMNSIKYLNNLRNLNLYNINNFNTMNLSANIVSITFTMCSIPINTLIDAVDNRHISFMKCIMYTNENISLLTKAKNIYIYDCPNITENIVRTMRNNSVDVSHSITEFYLCDG